MKIDLTKTEKQILIAYINSQLDNSQTPIAEGDVKFSNPQAIEGVDSSDVDPSNPNLTYVANTTITVSPIDENSNEGSIDIKYRRIDLEVQWKIVNGDNFEINFDKELNDDNLYTLVNQYYQREGIEFTVYPLTGTKKKLVITPKENSLLYTGKVTVTVETKSMDNNSLMKLFDNGNDHGTGNKHYLDGFVYDVNP